MMGADFTSPRKIAQLNIAHFSALLQTPLDDPTRATVKKLLAEEKAKLAKLAAEPPSAPPRPEG
jgi:hypothetical protein